jgi:hypothetical protein
MTRNERGTYPQGSATNEVTVPKAFGTNTFWGKINEPPGGKQSQAWLFLRAQRVAVLLGLSFVAASVEY